MQNPISFSEIIRTTNRVPFTRMDLVAASSFLDTSIRKGRDLAVGHQGIAENQDEVNSLAQKGIFIFTSPSQLKSAFLFTKNDAGRSILGKQKTVYTCYVGGTDDDEWVIGSVLKSWIQATTSIGNVYRQQGFS